MTKLRSFFVERGLEPNATSEQLVEFVKDTIVRGTVSRDDVLRLQAEDQAAYEADTEDALKSMASGLSDAITKLSPELQSALAQARDILEKAGMTSDEAVIESARIMSRQISNIEEIPSDLRESMATLASGLGSVFEKASPVLSKTLLSHLEHTNTTHDHNDNDFLSKEQKMATSASPTPAQVFGGAGQPNVRKASERYSTTTYEAKHFRFGHAVERNGETVKTTSERDKAKAGVFIKNLVRSRVPGANLPPETEHEKELFAELLNDECWVGSTADGRYFGDKGVKLPELFGNKGTALMSDATSGGSSLVPFVFDEAVVQYPLLSAQLLPYVDIKDISTGDTVHTPRMGNISVAWKQGPSEGTATVTLQTTDSLVDELDTSICDITAAGTLGINFISDSPVNVLQEFQTRIVSKMAADLDRVVAKGSGSGEPKGLQNTSGTKTVTASNSTAGPWKVADMLNIVEALPLQYRTGEYAPSVCWVMSDSAFFHIKGIATGLSGDQRLIYGYDLQKYMLHNFPVRISADLAANYVFFLPLKLFRMFRRKGVDFKITAEGQTLVLANLMLIAGRGRYGGQIIDANGVVSVSSGSLHS